MKPSDGRRRAIVEACVRRICLLLSIMILLYMAGLVLMRFLDLGSH